VPHAFIWFVPVPGTGTVASAVVVYPPPTVRFPSIYVWPLVTWSMSVPHLLLVAMVVYSPVRMSCPAALPLNVSP